MSWSSVVIRLKFNNNLLIAQPILYIIVAIQIRFNVIVVSHYNLKYNMIAQFCANR